MRKISGGGILNIEIMKNRWCIFVMRCDTYTNTHTFSCHALPARDERNVWEGGRENDGGGVCVEREGAGVGVCVGAHVRICEMRVCV